MPCRRDLFDRYNLSVPATYDEFVDLAVRMNGTDTDGDMVGDLYGVCFDIAPPSACSPRPVLPCRACLRWGLTQQQQQNGWSAAMPQRWAWLALQALHLPACPPAAPRPHSHQRRLALASACPLQLSSCAMPPYPVRCG